MEEFEQLLNEIKSAAEEMGKTEELSRTGHALALLNFAETISDDDMLMLLQIIGRGMDAVNQFAGFLYAEKVRRDLKAGLSADG